jgi:hypothetical protein
VWLHQNLTDRERLKTNLAVQVQHVRKSGVRPAIRLMKLWRVRNHVAVRNFVLELLTINLLTGKKAISLPAQLQHLLEQFRDHSADLSVEDPANPAGNDLSALLNESVKATLQIQALTTLREVETEGWERVFGPVAQEDRTAALGRAAAMVPASRRQPPWSHD